MRGVVAAAVLLTADREREELPRERETVSFKNISIQSPSEAGVPASVCSRVSVCVKSHRHR